MNAIVARLRPPDEFAGGAPALAGDTCRPDQEGPVGLRPKGRARWLKTLTITRTGPRISAWSPSAWLSGRWSYGFAILLRPLISGIAVGGTDLGFWFAQQGSILVFLVLIFFYAWRMNKLDKQEHGVDEKGTGQTMDQTTLNLLIVVGASFALYFGIAIWARAGPHRILRRRPGREPGHNGMATAADWMSAASFISMAGLIAFVGYNNSLFLMGWTGGYVLLAMLLAPYLRKFGKFTVPEFIGDRLLLQHRARGGRDLPHRDLGDLRDRPDDGVQAWPSPASSKWTTTTGLSSRRRRFVYAVLGGMKGITYTQVAQYCVLIVAYTIPAIFISLQLTGNPIPGLGLFSTMAEGTPPARAVPLLVTLDGLLTDLGFNEYTATTNPWLMALYTLSLMIGTAGLPHVIIRFFTVPKVADARWSAGWALVFIALLYLTAPAVGAMARLNITTTMWPEGVQGEAVASKTCPTGSKPGRSPAFWVSKTRTATAASSTTTMRRLKVRHWPKPTVWGQRACHLQP
jgi:putative solute:sodium symporter small subunit